MNNKYIYKKDVSSDKKLEVALRQSINDWSNEIPHHPYKNLGDKISVKSIWYKPAYPIRLRSQYEERSKNKDYEPFTGQNIPERKYHKLSDFNSWDIQLNKVKKFEDSTKKYYVNGSQYIEDCHHCDARGWITCNGCLGSKKITCPDCRGKKQVECDSCSGRGDYRCPSCQGQGYTKKSVTRYKEVFVRNPDGDGGRYVSKPDTIIVREPCLSCKRTGRKKCKTCGGDGEIDCQRCKTTGKITCPTCLGTGRIECPICLGQTQLMHHFYIERKLEYTDKKTCVIQEDIYENFPEFLEEFSNYDSKNIYSEKAEVINNTLPKDNHLNSYINKFLEEAEVDNTDVHSMQFQKLDISCIDTWEMRYDFEGKEYVIAFTGSNYKVIPGLSPIYEVAFNYWEKGVKASRFFMYSRANRFLVKALKIDVFEIKVKVDTALEIVKEKLNQSYSLGAVITLLLMLFFGGFISYTYFSEVNYMFGYVSFINNPENFLYPYHAWTQTLFSMFIIYLAYKTSNALLKRLEHHIPISIFRVAIGVVFTIVITAVFLSLWAFLNAVGISIIITFFVWLALKILWLIWWAIKIILGLIVLAAQLIWGILKWIWSLF